MKKILSNSLLLLICLTMLAGCFFGSCADWNCSIHNPRWTKAVHACYNSNFEIVKQKLEYKNLEEVQNSKIGRNIYNQCTRNAGGYDIRKDKQYSHLFVK